MGLFNELSINEIKEKLQLKDLCIRDLKNELIEKSKVGERYKVWAAFDKSIIEKDYDNLEKSIPISKSLYGIPVGVKDNMNTIDYATQMGSVIWKDYHAGNDARVVYNIKRNGGIVAGKTVTAEFAVHSLNETLNPYDIKRTPGTSSSGSAVAVATGMVPVALATQTAGSIIRPASFCGVFGYVPSFGLIPRTGVLKTTDSLDTIGFLTSHVSNLRTVLDSIRVKGPDYPFVFKNIDSKSSKRRNGPWKVLFAKTYTWEAADKYVRSNIEDFIKNLRDYDMTLVEEKDISRLISDAHEVHRTIYNKSLSYYFENEHKDRSRVSDVMNEMLDDGDRISTEEYLDALEKQEQMCKEFDQLLSKYDFIISASTASIAPLRGCMEKDDPSLIWTLLHLPSVGIPQFTETKTNLPYGIQISSRRYGDYLLLDFVEELSKHGITPKRINTIE